MADYTPKSCRLCKHRIIIYNDEISGCNVGIALPVDPDSLDNNCSYFEDIHKVDWFTQGGIRL